MIKIKKTFLLFMLLFGLLGAQDYQKDLSLQQKALMQKAYRYGVEFSLGYSMAAIMWQESFVGKQIVPFNVDDPGGGYWHKQLNYLLMEEKRPVNSLNRNMALERLITNMDYAAAIAIRDLENWINEFGAHGWLRVWAAYNGGYSNSLASQQYAKEVSAKVNHLMKIKIFETVEDSLIQKQ